MKTTLNKTTLKADVLTAKMLQSKIDGRLAVIKNVNEDTVSIYMERIGERVFSKKIINKGFEPLQTNKLIVISYFLNNFSPIDLFNKKNLFNTAFKIYDVLSEVSEDLTNVETVRILQEYVDKIDTKSEL